MSKDSQIIQAFVRDERVQNRINDLLKEEHLVRQFTTSLLAVANSNATIAKCTPETLFNAALTAASLQLPVNQSLGYAYIVPYKNKFNEYEAQFQIGYKGWIQLAERSTQYRIISATPVYEGQLVSNDPLKGIKFDWSVETTGDPIGYAAYIKLKYGLEKTLYMTTEQVLAHAKRYSQSYKQDLKDQKTKSLWSTDFEKMALKTVLKQLISKYGPTSTNIIIALEVDQAILTDEGKRYPDNDLEAEGATDDEKEAIKKAAKAQVPKEAK